MRVGLHDRGALPGLCVALWLLAGAAGGAGLPGCLKNAQWSASPIPRADLRTAQVAVKTNGGNLALLTVRAGDDLFLDVLELYRPSGEAAFTKKDLRIRRSYSLDADTGVETSNGADLWWHAVSENATYLEAQGGAQIYLCPAVAREPERAPAAMGKAPVAQIGSAVARGPEEAPPPTEKATTAQSGLAENGAACYEDESCKSGYCADGKRCAPKDGTGQAGDYCHHDNHCAKGLSCYCERRTHTFPPGFCHLWDKGWSGTCSAGQELMRKCRRDLDCLSGNCADDGILRQDFGRCAPGDGTGREGQYCHHDNHCETGLCVCPGEKSLGFCQNWRNYDEKEVKALMGKGLFQCSGRYALGELCTSDDHCVSGYCANGQRCAPRDGTGKTGEYCHHNNHCRSGDCICPEGKSWGFCANWEAGSNLGKCR